MATECGNGMWESLGRHLRTSTRTGPRLMSNDVQAGKPIPRPVREESFGPFKMINVDCPMVATLDCWRVFSGEYLRGVSLESVSGVYLWSVSLGCVTEVCGWNVSLSLSRCELLIKNGHTHTSNKIETRVENEA